MDDDALAFLKAYPWPGNIRQLENVVQQAVLVSSGPELLVEHLPEMVREQAPADGIGRPGNGHHGVDSLLHNREVLERNLILRALASNGYRRASAARALGISRVTLYKKMNKYGLMNSPLRGPRPE